MRVLVLWMKGYHQTCTAVLTDLPDIKVDSIYKYALIVSECVDTSKEFGSLFKMLITECTYLYAPFKLNINVDRIQRQDIYIQPDTLRYTHCDDHQVCIHIYAAVVLSEM